MPGGVVALGEPATVRGLALAGVRVIPAETPAQVRRAWATLPAGTAVVLLTPLAFGALGAAAETTSGPMVAVIPAATAHRDSPAGRGEPDRSPAEEPT